MAGFRPDWSPESRLTGFRRRWPDSDTGNISMVVGYLNVKVDCVV